MAASSLSDLGANVIKIEHRGRLDNTRLRGRAVVEGDSIDPAGPDEEVSHYFHLVNRGKRSVTLDLKDLAGLDLARRLALKADVIIENLPTGTLPRLGLDYANLSEGNKSLIWVSMSSLGSVGPKRDLRAYAPIMSSLAGAEALSGYEGERPTGMIAASIADPNASTHAVLAILAALNEREVSGTGQFIDIAQTDALISLLCEPLAHLQMTGEQPPCLGSRHSYWVPSGHFPCKDEGSFVALTVHSKDEWSALVALAGLTELAADPECRSAAGRRRRRTDIERALGAWTSSIPRDELVQKLQDAGVPAVAVVEYPEARQSFDDAFQRVDHPYVPGERVVGIPWRFADEPVPIRKSAPLIGEDTASVLREILGLSDETIAGLLDSRATY
jgi:crotonobetainyl-CoA:carnitine CoA-transferase CaiB-like acyl-CoA transferase